ncbi:MAG TPA: NAD(P)-dependent oxidoreductase [Acidimicrobiales bacterium]|nr:NAD(P)-dependent oxidoreductase [Acidimicrobiales bacterium]
MATRTATTAQCPGAARAGYWQVTPVGSTTTATDEDPAAATGGPVRTEGGGGPLKGERVVVTGVTGQVAEGLAVALAADNEVFGAARFSDPTARRRLEEAGVRCVPVDLAVGDVGGLPSDADLVLHFAVSKTNDWDVDLAANCGGLAWLMEHHHRARAFLHCSSAAVYRPAGHRLIDEESPLGDNHGVWPFLRTYSIAKIAAEATARWSAVRHDLPTTMARLSVPYGDRGGWPAIHLEMLRQGTPIPVHVDAPSVYHPLHDDDILRSIPALLAAASVPATVVNWGGAEAVSIEDWCGYLGDLTGLPVELQPTAATIDSGNLDLTRLHALAGPSEVPWREGMRRMVASLHPELLADG